MKRVFLSLLIVLGCAPIFSQAALNSELQLANEYTYLREGWQGTVGGGVGLFQSSMAFSVDGEFGKHITPKFYVGGGVAVNYNEAGALGLYISPRYYYSKKLNSFYVEASLGLTLLGVGKFDEYEYVSSYSKDCYYDKFAGPATGLAVGYVFNEKLSLEFGVNCFGSRYYRESERTDGSIEKSVSSFYYENLNCLLKVNYTFDLGNNLSEVRNKLKK